MKRQKIIKIALIMGVVFLIVITIYFANLEKFMDKQETLIFTQDRFAPESMASLRVVVRNHENSKPVEDAEVSVKISRISEPWRKITLFQGKTNKMGTAEIDFIIPEDEGNYNLEVQTSSSVGEDTIIKQIKIKRAYKILLTTDKPVYQPSQTIHIRALVLQSFDFKPASNKTITIEVEDSKGNKVFKLTTNTSEYGYADADFTLAEELNLGKYTIRGIVEDTTSEKKVEIKKYVLPKFKIELSTDRTYYLPGQTLRGEIHSEYFFSKPVTGTVKIIVSTFEAEISKIAEISGETDINGNFAFELELPRYFVGLPLEKGMALLLLNVTVIDKAGHIERVTRSIPVSRDAIIIDLVPESVVPDLENTIYVMTSYPDGRIAKTFLEILSEGRKIRTQTDNAGIATFRVIPDRILSVHISAEDRYGNQGSISEILHPQRGAESLLLRTDKTTYKVGETANLQILASGGGTVYVDFIKDKQTILTKAVDVVNGHAYLAVDLTKDFFGVVEIHAYKIFGTSDIVRNTRIIYVDEPRTLTIDVRMNKTSYRPGEEAQIELAVRNQSRKGTQVAIGLDIVDESVFALQEMRPGFESIYFALEEELMKPRYEIEKHVPKSDYQRVIKKAFTASQIRERFAIKVNSYVEKQNAVWAAKSSYFGGVSLISMYGLIFIPLLMVVLSVYAYRGDINDEYKKAFLKLENLIATGIVFSYILFLFRLPFTSGLFFDIPVLFIIIACGISAYKLNKKVENRRHLALLLVFVLFTIYLALLEILFNTRIYIGYIKPEMVLLLLISAISVPTILWANMRHISPPQQRQEFSVLAAGVLAAGVTILCVLFLIITIAGVVLPMAGKVAIGPTMHMYAETSQHASVPLAEVKVRQFFPETLYSGTIITDRDGKSKLNITMADSITTWRLSALASSKKGEIGIATESILVFQDFFIDIDLPRVITQGDEISVPVTIYNYLPERQRISLEIVHGSSFQLLDTPTKSISVQGNDVKVEYFRIKAKDVGRHKLTVYAYGSKMNDAVSRDVEVLPDGHEVTVSESKRLDENVRWRVYIPKEAIDGASKIYIKIYPGYLSQIVEGLDKILRMPFGCFEQTSSITYPNVLVLDYMKRTKLITPEIQMKAEHFISVGYQRLLSFETSVPGGFDWFGRDPPKLLLTAYGLMEFTDMKKVYPVDSNLIKRTQEWLVSQQNFDGSWEPRDPLHHTYRLKNSKLTSTCYVTWSLLHSGYEGSATHRSISYIKTNINKNDSYTLAVCANALTEYNPNDAVARVILEELDERKTTNGNVIYWTSSGKTFVGSSGKMKDLETTAMIAMAYMKAGHNLNSVNRILDYIIQMKDSYGTWGSTHTTVLSMKALLLSIDRIKEKSNAKIEIWINGVGAARINVTPENSDVLQLIDLITYTREGENTVDILFSGSGNLFYQAVARYYLPWAYKSLPADERLSIDVSYDKTTLRKNDIVTAYVIIKNNGPNISNWVIIDIGVPPGFRVLTLDLEKLKSHGIIERYDITERQIIIYLESLTGTTEFSYRLEAKYPIRAKAPASTIYEYYNPEIKGTSEPVEMHVS
jgi:uncharacterized protein YfaS (alpha-2-macroglobulin family)